MSDGAAGRIWMLWDGITKYLYSRQQRCQAAAEHWSWETEL